MERLCKINTTFGDLHDDIFFLGEPVSGKVQIVPNQELDIEFFGYHFILEARGKIKTSKKVLSTKYLLKEIKLLKNSGYMFDINLEYDQVETYKGINTNFKTRLEFFMKVKGKTPFTKPSTLLSKLIQNPNINNNFTENVYLTFQPKNNSYLINSPAKKLKLKYPKWFSLIFVIILWLIFTFLLTGIFAWKPKFLFLGIGIIATLTLTNFLFIKLLIGQPFIAYENLADNRFKVKINHQKRWKNAKSFSVSYAVHEQITDRRGTDVSRYKEDIFKSKEISKKNPINEESVDFDFPENIPGTITIEDSETIWLLTIKIKIAFGMVYTFQDEFIVKKN